MQLAEHRPGILDDVAIREAAKVVAARPGFPFPGAILLP
jgi:hypothetical protein